MEDITAYCDAKLAAQIARQPTKSNLFHDCDLLRIDLKTTPNTSVNNFIERFFAFDIVPPPIGSILRNGATHRNSSLLVEVIAYEPAIGRGLATQRPAWAVPMYFVKSAHLIENQSTFLPVRYLCGDARHQKYLSVKASVYLRCTKHENAEWEINFLGPEEESGSGKTINDEANVAIKQEPDVAATRW